MLCTGSENQRIYVDIFISKTEPSSSIKNGFKVITPEYDLHIHEMASSSYGGSYLHDKVKDLRELYKT